MLGKGKTGGRILLGARTLLIGAAAATAGAWLLPAPEASAQLSLPTQLPFFRDDDVTLEVTAQLSHGPGGMTITPDGSYIVSMHQYYRTKERVLEIKPDGSVTPFPKGLQPHDADCAELTLDSVLGIQGDSEGIVWMLDNGTRGESTPKIVAWDTDEDKLHRVLYLPEPITKPNSFLNDIALHPSEPFIYISDPASGADAAIIVVELETGRARRILEGRQWVVPEDIEIQMEGRPMRVKRPDGSTIEPQVGVNPIAVDRRGRWLYFGPMKGRTLYRISTETLHDTTLTPQELASRVEGYAEKPICDGISIDSKGNIYVSDVANNAIGVIRESNRKYEIYVTDARLSWPDGLCFGTDGKLHFFTNQLHRCAMYDGVTKKAEPPYLIMKVRAITSGSVGR
jgi:sugar lactone lactonase YvrE